MSVFVESSASPQNISQVTVAETPLGAVWPEDEVQRELLVGQKHVAHAAGQQRADSSAQLGDGDMPRHHRPQQVPRPSSDPTSSIDDDSRQVSDCVFVESSSAEHWGMARRFGFPSSALDSDFYEAEQAAQAQMNEAVKVCEQQWMNALRGVPLLANAMPDSSEPLRRLARKYGIPAHIRGIMWLTLSGVAIKMDENEGFCSKTLSRLGYVEDESGIIIEKDLERTFPHHPYFNPRGMGMLKLKHVLHAFCWRSPLIKYCQSFNFIAAMLLLVYDDEESAFWMLCHVVEQLLPNDYYGEGLLGIKVDQEVVSSLLRDLYPKLANHLDAIHFDVRALVPAWVMSLYINTFPIETVIRIWDLLFSQSTSSGSGGGIVGSMGGVASPYAAASTVLISVLIAFFKIHTDELMKIADSGDVLVFLTQAASMMFDSGRLIKVATDVKLSALTLHQLRRQSRAAVRGENMRRLNEKLKRQRLREQEQAAAAAASAAGVAALCTRSPTTPREGPIFSDPMSPLSAPGAVSTGHLHRAGGIGPPSDTAGAEMEMAAWSKA
jgi:hypothetical protein